MPARADLRWQDNAACRGEHPATFFPDSPYELPVAAQLLCLDCPVFDDCFAYGLTQKWGVWASTTEADRDRIRRRRGISLTPDQEPLPNLKESA